MSMPCPASRICQRHTLAKMPISFTRMAARNQGTKMRQSSPRTSAHSSDSSAGHELESLQPEERLRRRVGERDGLEVAARERAVDGRDAALAAVASRLEAPVVALGGAHEHGALGGRDAHLVDRHGDARRRQLRAAEARPQPTDDAGVGRIRDLEGAGSAQRRRVDGGVAAAELEEDEDEDAERDEQLEGETDDRLHGVSRSEGGLCHTRPPSPKPAPPPRCEARPAGCEGRLSFAPDGCRARSCAGRRKRCGSRS